MDWTKWKKDRFVEKIQRLRGRLNWKQVAIGVKATTGVDIDHEWLKSIGAKGVSKRGWGNAERLDALAEFFGIAPADFWAEDKPSDDYWYRTKLGDCIVYLTEVTAKLADRHGLTVHDVLSMIYRKTSAPEEEQQPEEAEPQPEPDQQAEPAEESQHESREEAIMRLLKADEELLQAFESNNESVITVYDQLFDDATCKPDLVISAMRIALDRKLKPKRKSDGD